MPKKRDCPDCEKRRKQDLENDEFGFALLVACVPLMVFTVFGQMGLF